MRQPPENSSGPLGLVWIDCPYPVASIGLARILESKARVHVGQEPPEGEIPSSVVLCSNVDDVSGDIEHVRNTNPQALIMAFGLYLDLALARAALRGGAR